MLALRRSHPENQTAAPPHLMRFPAPAKHYLQPPGTQPLRSVQDRPPPAQLVIHILTLVVVILHTIRRPIVMPPVHPVLAPVHPILHSVHPSRHTRRKKSRHQGSQHQRFRVSHLPPSPFPPPLSIHATTSPNCTFVQSSFLPTKSEDTICKAGCTKPRLRP